MNDAARAADTLLRAAELNRTDPLLTGSLLELPDYGQVVMTGDLHGHRRNFERIRRFCNLELYRPRHVILHEIIHEELEGSAAIDRSYQVLLEAAEWKAEFPDQVHFLQSNHELAQLTRHEITKNGRVVTFAFEEGVEEAFGGDAPEVMRAIETYIHSLPLAARTPNGVFLSHSLPGPRDAGSFDATVFERTPTDADFQDGGPVHALVWGRYQTAATIEQMRAVLGAEYFICGHQPQDTGYEILHDRMIILASDHNHGVFLTLELAKPVSIETLTRNIRPLAAIE